MKNEGRFNRFLNGKGFYVALGICMVAIGISAWTAMSGLSKKPDTTQNSSNQESFVPDTGSEVTVDKPQSDIPHNQTSSEKKTESSSSNPTTEAGAPVAKYFVFPVSGEVIKNFSDTELQYSLTYNDLRLHKGIDIKADVGTAVKSAGDGTVTFAGKDPLLGYTVKIDHGNNITAVYAGLHEAITVKKGDTVTAGTNVGPLGTVTSECVDAPHLHLEFFDGTTAVDPLTRLTTN